MNRYLVPVLLALIGAAGCVNAADDKGTDNPGVTASGGDTHSVNGSIRVPAGTQNADVTTVNGSIRIDDNATASTANTVNGDIRVGAHATIGALHTVNGDITLGSGAHVNSTLTTVNGAVKMGDDAQVSGAVTNVSGDIVLTAAHVAGGIQSVNGDINLRSNSRVEGGILVRKPSSSFLHWQGSAPRIVIGPGASVQGSLRFEREVKLYVSDRATIGPVSGATPIRYSGDNPPG